MHNAKLALLLAAALALASATPSGAQSERQPVTLVAPGTALHYMPHLVAERTGIYAAENISVDFVTVKSGAQATAAIMGGSADLAWIGFFEVVKAAAMGGKVVILAPQYDIYATSLVLSNAAIAKTGIIASMPIDEKVKRLRGLQIGISAPGSNSDAFIRSLYLARGMNPDSELVLRPLGDGASLYAALERKITDGFVWAAPMPERAVLNGIGQVAVDPFSGEIPELRDVPFTAIMTSREVLAKKPEIIRATLRAYTKAVKWMREKPEEARAIVRAGYQDIDDASFNRAFDKYLPGFPPTPVVSPQQFERALTWLNLGAKTTMRVGYDDVIEPGIAREIEKDIVSK